MRALKFVVPAVLATMCASGAALGQIAQLNGLQGTVLVTKGDALVAATNGQQVAVGARIVTTAGAQVTVSYARGCTVKLGQNQRFVVRDSTNCAALTAAVEGTARPSLASARIGASDFNSGIYYQAIGDTGAGAGAGAGGNLLPLVIAGGVGAGMMTYAISQDDASKN